MRAVYTFIALFAFSALSWAGGNKPYSETAHALTDIKAATATAKKGELILVSFGANWCLNCRRLANHLHEQPLESWLQNNFKVVKVNIGNWNKNEDAIEAFDNPIQFGIPAVVLLDHEGNLIKSLPSHDLIPAIHGGADKLKAYLQTAKAEI